MKHVPDYSIKEQTDISVFQPYVFDFKVSFNFQDDAKNMAF